MSKEEFLSQLRKKLKKLPPDDLNDALEYYEEYLEDAGAENEAAAIAAWGSPDRVASQITADYAVKQMGENPSAKKGLSTVWIVVLAIFASPIAIPVAAVIALAMLIVVMAVGIVIVCFYAAAVTVALVGAASFILGICLLFQSFQTAIFYIGAGLFFAGAGVAIFLFSVWFSKKSFNVIAKIFSKFISRRKAG